MGKLFTTNYKIMTMHPDLFKVWEEFTKTTKLNVFMVETARSEKKQAANVAKGASTTKRSRHVLSNNKSGRACAMDLAPCSADGKVIFWKRLDLFQQMNKEIMAAAARLGIPIEWGGVWKKFKDLDHWQLSWKVYP